MKNLWNSYEKVRRELGATLQQSRFGLKCRVYIQGGLLTIATIVLYILVAFFN